MFHGLSRLETRQLAFKFAAKKQKVMPENWISNEAAGKEWLKGFRKRSQKLSLRQPEATSLARATAFNVYNVGIFFDNVKTVFTNHQIPPERIFNLDETGISTVQKVGQILAETGTKQVGRITSGERGENVTLCACVNAIGNSIPPAFIFPRVRFKQHMLKGCPNGSFGTSCSSGWMNSDIFPSVLQHFVKFMNVSKQNPGLLVFDNHRSHLGIEVVKIAEENGLNIVTFPPHCSHRQQPLDVSVFKPFKTYYNSFCDAWMTSHPGRPITIYDIAELVGLAYAKSFTPSNITSGFEKTGIYPYNPHIFTEDMFLPAAVTDIAFLSTDPSEDDVQQSESLQTSVVSASSTDEQLLTEIRPHAKTSATSRKRKSRQQKSTLLTSEEEKRKRFPELFRSAQSNSSSESEEEMPSVSSDSADDVSINESTSEDEASSVSVPSILPTEAFIVVKVYNSAANCRNFVAQIVSGPDEDNDYEVKFLKRSTKVKNAFVFPDVEDLASVSYNDVVCVLSNPSPVAHTARLSNILRFTDNVAIYDV